MISWVSTGIKDCQAFHNSVSSLLSNGTKATNRCSKPLKVRH
jgi:hypothetical protein